MTITYQGRSVETDKTTVAEFLAEREIRTIGALVEYKGEAYSPGTALDMPLEEGAELNVFQMIAGGGK
ncbi:MAG: MoaD/ThiS family protein [Kiritimatiellae bacterium]|nr:MoaD/ThiS family protein [Kiritimatiellia bacterium]